MIDLRSTKEAYAEIANGILDALWFALLEKVEDGF